MNIMNMKQLSEDQQKKVLNDRLNGHVYIGRKTGEFHFGNPFSHRSDTQAQVVLDTREDAIRAFKRWVLELEYLGVNPVQRRWVQANVIGLCDQDLVCWCAPESCHGEVLKAWAEDPIPEFQDMWRFLSNFWYAPIKHEGLIWRNSENLYQWAKQSESDRRATKASFCQMNPGQSKRAGKTITLRPDWEEKKELFMLRILQMKFDQNPHLKKLLLATGDAWLQEGNRWHDQYWGVCTCARCCGVGRNRLGISLMKLREMYRDPS